MRKKENHENITKENAEQMGVQEWMGKEPHWVEGRLVLVKEELWFGSSSRTVFAH